MVITCETAAACQQMGAELQFLTIQLVTASLVVVVAFTVSYFILTDWVIEA